MIEHAMLVVVAVVVVTRTVVTAVLVQVLDDNVTPRIDDHLFSVVSTMTVSAAATATTRRGIVVEKVGRQRQERVATVIVLRPR